MNIHINSTNQDDMQTLIIGVPEHMNQLKDIVYHEQSLIDDLNVLKKIILYRGNWKTSDVNNLYSTTT